MSRGVCVRDATAEDHPVFARLFPALGVDDPVLTPEQFAARMVPTTIVVDDGSTPIGYAFWQVHGLRGHVVHVIVDERARGRGAGRVLMEGVRGRLLAARCSRWHLNVKQDNGAAIRLYEKCGLAIEQEGWALRTSWSQLASMPEPRGAVTVHAPHADDDPVLASRFDETVERIRALRDRPGVVILSVREAAAPAAFAAFDPSFPGVYPIRVARPDLARPLFDGLRAHAREDRVQVFVEGDRALAEAMQGRGARVHIAMFRMGGSPGALRPGLGPDR
jgi:GNAT superfamily N-acetyltransferase